MKKRAEAFPRLKKVFTALHGPKGCMWDKEQTQRTLIPYLKEEVGELIAAVRSGDQDDIMEELGDLLLHVMFNAQIAQKNGWFDIEDVIEGLIAKLKRRHPHVFCGVRVGSSREIITNWDRIKREEKRSRRFKRRKVSKG